MTGENSKHDQRRFSIATIVIVGAFVALVVAIIIPALGSARVNPRWLQDISQLRGIALSIDSYAGDHDGNYPSNIRLLAEKGYCSEDQFISNADPVQTMRGYLGEEPPEDLYQHGSFIFFPTHGLRIGEVDNPSRFVLAYSPFIRNRDEKQPVVFLDGETEVLSYEELWELLASQRVMLDRIGSE